MKRLCGILMFFSAVLSWAQPNSELNKSINQIKMDRQYLYGVGTEKEQAQAEMVALMELSNEVAQYCQDQGFSYIKQVKDLTENPVQFISGPISNRFRSLAYLPKHILDEAEAVRVQALENEGRALKVRAFIGQLKEERYIEGVRRLLQEQGNDISVIFGEVINHETQKYLDQSYLVYFDKAGLVLEMMTPKPKEGKRENLATGKPANPFDYKTTPLWIYIEGINLDL